MTPQQLSERFWTATHYYRAPSPPPEEWDADLRRCRDMRLELVQVRVFWRWHERHEGSYFWDDLDEFVATAQEAGCRVIFQLNLENAPEYIFQRYEGYRVDIRGNRIWPTANASFYVGGWIPCFDHPEVMRAALRFTEALVARYREHPALAFYHAWNEPRCRPMGECACPDSIASYRAWLEARFGTVEALNRAFGKCWGDFSQVDAARDTSDFAEMFLWRQWGADRVRDRVARVTELLRRLDPERAVISHVGNAGIFQDPLFDISDDVLMNDVTDMYGTSFPVRVMPEYQAFMLVDWMRFVGRGKFTVYELYPSVGQFLPEVPAGLIQEWMWISVAGGASGLCFWQFKKERLGVEVDDAGLVEMDGSDNATSVAAAESLRQMRAWEREIPGWRVPEADIALVYDLAGDLTSRLEFTLPREADYVGRYMLRSRVAGGYPAKGDLQGVYNLLWQSHYAVDFLAPSRWEETISRYKVVILAGFPVIDAERARVLTEYVERGGFLVVDAGFGRRQSNTMLYAVRPGAGLAERFGFREKLCRQLNDKVWTLEIDGVSGVEALFERVEYEVAPGTEVIGRWSDNGAPAAVLRRIGRGTVAAVGAAIGLGAGGDRECIWNEVFRSMGMASFPEAPEAWKLVLERLLGRAGVGRAGCWNHPGIAERAMRDRDGAEIRFAFRRFDGGHRPDDGAWEALDLPGAQLLASFSDVKIWKSTNQNGRDENHEHNA